MNEAAAATVRELVKARPVAALGTLHNGEPFVSMVPFAPLPDGSGLVIHVSRLAAHTADMMASPRVSLMIAAVESPDVPPQALARITLTADAVQLSGAEAEAARTAYLARFPDAEPLFSLGDFSLFAIRPRRVRVVGGFGMAATIDGTDFAAAMR